MKKYSLILALCLAVVPACKNTKTASSAEEDSQMEMSREALAQIDSLLEEFCVVSEKVDLAQALSSSLSDKEKKVKPEYLLDPFQADRLVTKTQKVNALAFYVCERPIRNAYSMDVDGADRAIARLMVDLNHPCNIEDFKREATISERIHCDYDKCRERGDALYFWKFVFAAQTAIQYTIAQRPEVFFRNISPEAYAAYREQIAIASKAMGIIAQYDTGAQEALTLSGDLVLLPTLAEYKEYMSGAAPEFSQKRTRLLML